MAEGGFRVTTSLVRRTSTGAGGGVASIGRPAIIDPRTGKTVSSPSRVVKTEGGAEKKGSGSPERKLSNAPSTSRSPSPFTVMNDQELYMNGLGRSRTSSP
eukprot:gene23398-26513_t